MKHTIIDNRKLNKLNRNIKLDYLFSFVRNLDMASAVWVLYLTYKGMSLLQIGILEGIYHITSMVFEVPSGAVADLLGRKKTVVVGRIGMTLSCICMLFAGDFRGFALGFFIQAVSNTLNSGAEEALLYDSMKLCGRENEFLKVSGRLNMLMEIAQGIAVVAGGILAEYSYAWCYGVSAIVAVIGFFTALCMTEAVVPEGAEAATNQEGMVQGISKSSLVQRLYYHFADSIGILKGNIRIRNLVIYYSSIFAAYTLLYFYSQQYYYDMGLNKIQISFIMLAVGVFSCIGAFCSEKLYERLGHRTAGSCAMLIAVCIIAFGLRSLPVAIVALVLASFCNSVLYPIQSISLNRLIPSKQRATLISVDSMAFSVGMVLFFPIVGALADVFGLAIVFAGLGILLTAGIVATRRVTL